MTNTAQIYKSTSDLEAHEIRAIYDGFDSPIATFDCERNARLITQAANRIAAIFAMQCLQHIRVNGSI